MTSKKRGERTSSDKNAERISSGMGASSEQTEEQTSSVKNVSSKYKSESKIKNQTVRQKKGERTVVKKLKNRFSALTKKQKIFIVATTVVLLVAMVATAIAVPLTLRAKPTIAQPYFYAFEPQSGDSIVVKWKSVYTAQDYNLEYVYGSPETGDVVKGKTQNTTYTVARKKGVLAVRVKANLKDGSGRFGEWIYLDVVPLKLDTPIVTISEVDAKVSWAEIRFTQNAKRKPISVYSLDIGIENMWVSSNYHPETNSFSALKEFILDYFHAFFDPNKPDTWQDVAFNVRIRALNIYRKGGVVLPSDGTEYEFLYNAYAPSEYGTATLTVTKEIYEGLKK